ncbi:SGNH/GDSL hydrolase family protein [Chlamydiota bacterium]
MKYIFRKQWILFVVLMCCMSPLWALTSVDLEEGNNAWVVWTQQTARGARLYSTHWDGIKWTDPAAIFPSFEHDQHSPSLALTVDGVPWIAFVGEDEDTSIYCAKWGHDTWEAPVCVSRPDRSFDGQPSITVDSEDGVHVVWVGVPGVSDEIYYAALKSTGWTKEQSISTEDSWPDNDPVVRVLEDGVKMVVWSGYDGENYRLFYTRMADEKWEKEVPVGDNKIKTPDEFPCMYSINEESSELLWIQGGHIKARQWNRSGWGGIEDATFNLITDRVRAKLVGVRPAQVSLSWMDRTGLPQALRYNIFSSTPKTSGAERQNGVDYSRNERRERFWDIGENQLYAEVIQGYYTGFGDSITKGEPPNDPVIRNYPELLEEKLVVTYGSGVVFNEGWGGERTSRGLSRINSVLASHNAEIILIMEGTNDAADGRSSSSVAFNLEEMARRSINHGTIPILGTVTPRLDVFNNRIIDLNTAIFASAGSLGVLLTDQYSAIAGHADPGSLYSDGRVHFNVTGHDVIAEAWLATIRGLKGGGSGGGGGCGSIFPDSTSLYFNNSLLIIACFLLFLIKKYIVSDEKKTVHVEI